MNLGEWVASHGALWPTEALVVALDLATQVSHLSPSDLRAAVDSLDSADVVRVEGRWRWVPVRSTDVRRFAREDEVVRRIGAILFFALTTERFDDAFASEQTIRTRLRASRSELSAEVVDLTVSALSDSRGIPRLPAFAKSLQRVLGVDRSSQSRRRRTIVVGAGAVLLVAALAGVATWKRIHQEPIGSHGLTMQETVVLDILAEDGQTWALADEHTTAYQQYDRVARLWGQHLVPDDPRLAWNLAHIAWVRTLAGDRLTAEQVLGTLPDWLTRQLGENHPYTRVARLGLAAAREARGAGAEAKPLRDQAARGVRDLFQNAGLVVDPLPGVPTPPGTIAHVEPSPPEREGFRRAADGRAFIPLTSVQRMNAGNHGWQLSIVATGTCRTAFVVGLSHQPVSVAATRTIDGWQVQVDGTAPPVRLAHAASAPLGIVLTADGTGAVNVAVSDTGPQTTHIDPAAAGTAAPPYALTFDGGTNGTGCQVVWLEIPFPFAPHP